MTGYAVSPGWATGLRTAGIDPEAVLRRAGLPADLFTGTRPRIDAEDYFALWSAAEAELPGEDLALRVAESLSTAVFDVALFAGLCCADLASAARRVATYKRLLYPVGLDVQDDDGLRIAVQPRGGLEPPPVVARFEMLFWVAFARIATGTRVEPSRIVVPQVPGDQTAHVAYLGVPLTEGRSAAVHFPTLAARRPFATASPAAWGVFEPELNRRLNDLERAATWTQRVESTLLEALPAGRRSIAETAADLHVSTRSLQRHLGAEDTSYQEVLGRTRERIARHYLRHSELTDAEIAFLVGYDELTSFLRAFRGWTGHTPRVLRAQAS